MRSDTKKKLIRLAVYFVIFIGLVLTGLFGVFYASIDKSVNTKTAEFVIPLPNTLIAFVGDQGLGENSRSVLDLIRKEKADLAVFLGDFDYTNSPQLWNEQLLNSLEDEVPYIGVVGNHDLVNWNEYQEILMEAAKYVKGLECSGNLGVKSVCSYKGIFFVLSGVGTTGFGHERYIGDKLLGNNRFIWKICAWHKNQHEMQVGGKFSEVGWGAYEECRKNGAIIATGHEHSYSRTKTLVDMKEQTVHSLYNKQDDIHLGNGYTFSFVSGLGGKSIRSQKRCGSETYPYGCKGEWASIYTSSQDAKFGVLFIRFNIDNDPNKASAYFKNINGEIVDEFQIYNVLPVNKGINK